MNLIIPLIIIIALASFAWWAVGKFSPPAPLSTIAQVLIVGIALFAIIGLFGYGPTLVR